MRRLRNPNFEEKKSGLSTLVLRAWAMIFLAAGVIGRSVLQIGLLDLPNLSSTEMMTLLNDSTEAVKVAGISLILQAVEVCAIPLYAFFLVEGFQNTSDRKRYALRVAGLALLTELPYNLALSGKLFFLQSRNPVFGVLLGMAMLYFFETYGHKRVTGVLVGLLVTVAAVFWCVMLGVEHGILFVLLTAVLWIMRNKPLYRGFIGTAVACICFVISPFYLAAVMGFMLLHFYNGESEKDLKHVVAYPFYPVLLLLAYVIGLLI